MPSPRRALSTLFVIVFTDLIGFGIVIPLLPLYAEHYRPTPWAFGLLMAAYSAMQFLFAPLLGRLSDRVGRRPVLVVSLIGSVCGYLLFAAAHSLAALFASRIIAGIAGANIATAQAVIADITTAKERARGMGLIGAAFGLGFIAGPALAGGLVGFGEAAPGLGAAAFSLLALVMTLVLLPESLPPERRRTAPGSRWGAARLTLAWRRRELAPLFAIGFLTVTGMAMFEVTFAQLLHDRFDLSHAHVAFMFVYVGVLAAFVQGGLVGRLAHRFGERPMVVAGLAFSSLGLALLAAGSRLGAVVAVMPLLALGQGITTPSLSALVSHAAGEGEQGEVLGGFQGVSSLARVVGPFSGEMALGTLGVGAPPLGASLLALAALVGAAVWLGRHRREAAGAAAPAAEEID
ncbi:MAG: MFS transporter [Acidobacteriota bacterium]